MKKVFISSTSADLKEYRQAATETCLRLGFHPIAMEHFPSMPVGATVGSKQKLEEADLYVGIFAHRYGYIEDGYDQSVTEIEFGYAGELNLDRLCFVVDPEHKWSPATIDYDQHERQKNFIDRINKTLIRATFTDVSDFEAKLTQALVSWGGSSTVGDTLTDSIVSGTSAPPQPVQLQQFHTQMQTAKVCFVDENGKFWI
jgi:hypothetical protein